ncbi:hypothetical protein D3C71_1732350 [compost metagenome]
MRQFGGLEDVALGHQFQPVGNEVVHRALPFAIRVTATQAAVGLVGRLLGFEGFVDFHELFLALTQQFLLRILAPDLDELEVIIQTFSHFKTSSNSSGAYHCGLARVLESNDFRLAALGLTSQKRRT